MKPRVLLAALLLLPASITSTAQPLPYSPQFPSPAVADIRMVRTTAAAGSGAPVGSPSWEWPLAPRPAVLRGFDPPPKPWLSGHRGVDLETADPAAAVRSPAAGTVRFVGLVVDRPVITIDHGGGLRSSFEPVDSTLTAGSPVARGQVIGTALPGHCPAAGCIHWGVRRGEDYVDPLQFVLDLRPSVLLPLHGGG